MKRQRLTITLKQEILRLLDNYIDGSRIRNRSHAIEYILTKQLFPSSIKVLILAGGQGVKLRPITYELPKALIPIHKKPLLEHTLNQLAKNNLKEIILSVGYLGDKIEEYFQDGSKYGVNIKYVRDPKKSQGTAPVLLNTKSYLEDKTFFVIHGDVLAHIDYLDMLEFHKKHGGLATVALTSVDRPKNWGVAYVQGNKVVEFKEKPASKVSSHLINAGVYIFNTEIFNHLQKKDKMLSRDVLPGIAEKGELYAYIFKGQWHDVGSTQAYTKALKQWRL
ncbi:MAG: NTP transferase domain-containing protein [Candidatus Moranbacteria bacterium]|nr:NTP transferase domain-containing protein [Candidatus Moranbacteria bacterium]